MIKKWLIKLSQFSNTRKLLLCFTIFLFIFIITALLHLDIIAIIAGFISIALTIILLFAFLIRFSKDEEPLPLADFRKVENITNPEYSKLYDVYFKETGRTVNRTEKYYINWLELQATKFIVLNEGLPK